MATASWLTEMASVASIMSVAKTRPRSWSGTSPCRAKFDITQLLPPAKWATKTSTSTSGNQSATEVPR